MHENGPSIKILLRNGTNPITGKLALPLHVIHPKAVSRHGTGLRGPHGEIRDGEIFAVD
jgi:hypothetical protein